MAIIIEKKLAPEQYQRRTSDDGTIDGVDQACPEILLGNDHIRLGHDNQRNHRPVRFWNAYRTQPIPDDHRSGEQFGDVQKRVGAQRKGGQVHSAWFRVARVR